MVNPGTRVRRGELWAYLYLNLRCRGAGCLSTFDEVVCGQAWAVRGWVVCTGLVPGRNVWVEFFCGPTWI